MLKFDAPCKNAPDNPYGVDFTIFGNAFSGSSEPGVVWVMKDENQNGRPDDTWYEIAGSHHFHSKTVKNYGVTYFKTASRDVKWKDENGNSGFIKANSYNTQDYYPTAGYFPDFPADSVSFTGTKLYTSIIADNPLQVSLPALDFGYADNHPKKQGVNPTVPDNPYSPEVEGAGGDPIDISWAVDNQGKYIGLDEIHFVKIATGFLADLGRLGEVSTDVSYVVDADPDETAGGNENLLVVYHPPSKIVVGDTINLEAGYFKNGRIQETDLRFSSSDSEIIISGNKGELIAQKQGIAEVQVVAEQESKKFEVEVVVPDSIAIQADLSSVYPGDTVLLNVQVFDNRGNLLETETNITSSNPSTGKIIWFNNDYYFVAENPGENSISVKVKGFDLQESMGFRVLSESDKIRVYFTLKTENENLLPLQLMEVGLTDMNFFIERRQQDYSELNRLTLAHAILAGLQHAKFNFVFRDDENSGSQLYLYSVENEGLFWYGWGGKTEPQAFAQAWIARLNGSHFLNDFDAIDIANGDTIVLYHVYDITSEWKFSRLTANKDSATAGETVELLVEQTTCRLENDTIWETPLLPIENQVVVAGENYLTNENGKVEVTLDSNPPWIFYAGNDAISIHQKIATGLYVETKPEFTIYPNPAKHFLHIEGQGISGAKVSVLNSAGKKMLQNIAKSGYVSFNVSNLKNGFYFVKIENETEVKTAKFIKRK
ncbi:MAG: T9SS type A sorting domain-containing protein [Prolixibacteraceae bacterium]